MQFNERLSTGGLHEWATAIQVWFPSKPYNCTWIAHYNTLNRHSHTRHSLAVIQQMLAAESDIVFSTVHVVFQLTEGNLRLYHPELCQVPAGVTICTIHSVNTVETRQQQLRLYNAPLFMRGQIHSKAEPATTQCLFVHVGHLCNSY